MKTVLIVGAGFSGVSLARELVDNDPDIFVEIIEERPHIGGNAYDYDNEKTRKLISWSWDKSDLNDQFFLKGNNKNKRLKLFDPIT